MRKNLFIALTVITGMVISLASCILGTDVDTLRDKASKVVTIKDIEGVNAPIIDETPATTIIGNDQYSGTVSWSPAVPSRRFAPDTVYTALITLKQKPGYTMDGVPNDFFTVAGASAVRYSADSYDKSSQTCQLTATFPSTFPLTPVNRIEYYWVDQYDSLVTTSGGAVSIITGSTLTISPQGTTGYDIQGWYVNGVATGESGDTFIFNITTVGKHTVDLFLGKDGNLYSTSITIEVLTNVLTANTWADGNLLTSSDEQWFKFTATTSGTQYIHVSFDTLSSLNVQVNNSTGNTVVSTTLYDSSGSSYTNFSTTSGQTYYINVNSSGNTGTYQIAFNTSNNPPLPSASASAIQLTANTWADGSLTSLAGEQWFKFTATSSMQYIHASFGGTLNSSYGVYVQVYSSTGSTVGNQTRLYGSSSNGTRYTSISVTSGQLYYIKVTPYSSNTGTYQITFNTSYNPPPPSTATQLTANTWANGNLTSSTDEQWFKFTATSSPQYIHIRFSGSSNSSAGLYIQLYDSSGSTYGYQTTLYNNSPYITSVSTGQIYYIKVTPSYSGYYGTYQIAFNTSYNSPSAPNTTPPNTTPVAPPISDSNDNETSPIPLINGEWDGEYITSTTSAVWYSFNVTNGTTYYVWWYDRDNVSELGAGIDVDSILDIRVAAYYGNGTEIFNVDTSQDINGISNSKLFTATQSGTVKLKVYPLNGVGYTGNFAIVYSTGSTRPAGGY